MSVSEKIAKIRGALRDEESRVIFRHMAARFAGGGGHIRDMLMELNEFDKLKLLPADRRPNFFNASRGAAVFYGAGGNAPSIREFAETIGITPEVFCDSDERKWDTEFYGVPVVPPDAVMTKFVKLPIIVSSPIYEDEITKKLIQTGVEPDRIFSAAFSERQYFGLPFLKPEENEIFIDAGAYDGQDVVKFAQFSGGAYEKIYALEPDPGNCRRTESRVKAHGLRDVTIVEKGAWNHDGVLRFSSGGSGSRLTDDGDIEMPVTAIDSIAADGVTFIKMDIEGAELEALKGARESILRFKPKLAVCVYHKPEDIFDIPEFLLEINPEYGLYLRHHTLSAHETVLYAVME